MKRYIRSTTENNDVFDTSTTNMSYYDNFLNPKDLKYMQESKNLDGKIVYMTPDEYYKECVKIFKNKYTTKQLELQRSDDLLPEYVDAMKSGSKFPLCFINYANESQEGLHRMLAARKAFGSDKKYPVLVVKPYDMDVYNHYQLLKEIRDFERYDFEDIVEGMESHLGDWTKPVPEDIASQAKRFIEDRALKLGYDIQVDCEVVDHQGDDRLEVTLTHYKGEELDYQSVCSKSPWLANMFDTNGEYHSDDFDIDDEDLDIDVSDFFFK